MASTFGIFFIPQSPKPFKWRKIKFEKRTESGAARADETISVRTHYALSMRESNQIGIPSRNAYPTCKFVVPALDTTARFSEDRRDFALASFPADSAFRSPEKCGRTAAPRRSLRAAKLRHGPGLAEVLDARAEPWKSPAVAPCGRISNCDRKCAIAPVSIWQIRLPSHRIARKFPLALNRCRSEAR